MGTDNNNKRVLGFDVIRGILILAIAIAHSLEIGAMTSELGKTLYYLSYTFHVPAIVFLSGYFLKRERITVRWVVENTIYYLGLFFLAKLMYYGMYLLVDGALPPWTISSVWGEMAVPWYMLSIAEWYIIIFVLKTGKPIVVGLLSVAVALIAGYFSLIGGMFSLSRTLVFFPFFFLAYALPKEKLFALLLSQSTARRLMASAGLVTLMVLVGVWIQHRPQMYGMTINLLYGNCDYKTALAASFTTYSPGVSVDCCAAFRGTSMLFSSVCIFLLLIVLAGIQRHLWIWNWLARIGQNSLSVYIVHFPILLFLWRRVIPNRMSGLVNCVTAYALGIVVTILLAWCPLKAALSEWRRLCSRIANVNIRK